MTIIVPKRRDRELIAQKKKSSHTHIHTHEKEKFIGRGDDERRGNGDNRLDGLPSQ